MERMIEAVYSNGVLRPVEPIDWLEENRRVTLTITPSRPGGPLAGWVGGLSDEDAREMIRAVDEGFERVDPDDWKWPRRRRPRCIANGIG